ncbi:hypothetical protein [Clostridium estertheticum]|uniref:hypothetical protein n=1 Tax=Clostridium estertheticum TaxID=238834 RepID=UPI00124C46A3|nr:hypothetical protein [Clostridium estertheticum]MBZ9618527.1 hypothetical protein [Clostridium estertheticum subsp. laramiense]MCB2362290.1 hypothetical protein [Clostridium estertheticum]WAG76453.1 hypothetical protein LL032_24140 [Clostridium estertheticum]
MKKIKKFRNYIIFLIAGILVGALFNIISSKNIKQTGNIQTKSIVNNSPNSGFRYTISKNKNRESNAENLIIKGNSFEFYLNIDNYYKLKKTNNVICIFINNIQVNFDLNDNKNNPKYTFNLEPKNNCFKIKINNLKVTKNENDLLLIISEKDNEYDITSDFEERKSNSTHFINTKIFNYNIKNVKDEYQDYDEEKDAKINDGIYVNKSLNENTITGSVIVKAKPNEKIHIPIIIKNSFDYSEASLILLINDKQYKLDNRNNINFKLNNSLAKIKVFCIETPKAKGNYKLKIAMCYKNNEHRQYRISNTINLILE